MMPRTFNISPVEGSGARKGELERLALRCMRETASNPCGVDSTDASRSKKTYYFVLASFFSLPGRMADKIFLAFSISRLDQSRTLTLATFCRGGASTVGGHTPLQG